MRNVLARWRINQALDSNEPIAPELRRRIDRSEELRDYERCSRAVDQALKGGWNLEVPERLHESIMGAVRENSRTPVRGPLILWARLAPAVGLLMVAAAIATFVISRVGPTPVAEVQGVDAGPTLEVAVQALDASEHAGSGGTDVLVQPLEEERDRLSKDLDDLADFVLASIP